MKIPLFGDFRHGIYRLVKPTVNREHCYKFRTDIMNPMRLFTNKVRDR